VRLYTADPFVDLEGSVDFEARVAGFPVGYTLRGMFFPRLIALLENDWSALRKTLSQPPRDGRYVPLEMYPQADYARVAGAVARRYFPHVSLLEGLRRVGRQDFQRFVRTAMGRVFVGVLRDVSSTLLNYPVIYPLVMHGMIPRSSRIEGGVRIELPGYLGVPEYSLGTYEGFVYAFGHTPSITLEEHHDELTVFDVRWT
jgi:uncharacterized protein (TIGR02265 family)